MYRLRMWFNKTIKTVSVLNMWPHENSMVNWTYIKCRPLMLHHRHALWFTLSKKISFNRYWPWPITITVVMAPIRITIWSSHIYLIYYPDIIFRDSKQKKHSVQGSETFWQFRTGLDIGNLTTRLDWTILIFNFAKSELWLLSKFIIFDMKQRDRDF